MENQFMDLIKISVCNYHIFCSPLKFLASRKLLSEMQILALATLFFLKTHLTPHLGLASS